MKVLVAVATLGALVCPSVAGQDYDHRLEAQMQHLVASKIGDIRGTLPYDRIIVFPAPEQVSETPSFRTIQSIPVSAKPHFQTIE